jgi:NAD(P)-dependent dehydrogenase (short-subunit alcohol dehydrogenase family)
MAADDLGNSSAVPLTAPSDQRVLVAVTVITGAGGGMGLACVEVLRSSPLLLVDIDPNALDVASALAPDAVTSTADLGSPSDLAALVQRVEQLGGLRHLIHLAGVSPTMDDVDRILQVDLVGTAILVDSLAGAAGPGSVAVCAASIAGHLMAFPPEVDRELDRPLASDLPGRLEHALGSPLSTGLAYSLAKRGVIRLCERVATVWGALGGRVVSLSPGLIDTPMGRLELRDNEGKRGLVGLTPVTAPADGGSSQLPGRNADIANVVEFLVSPQARFLSGCDVRVDGGLVAALRSGLAGKPPR